MTIKPCPYVDSKGHCWYRDHTGSMCEFVHREWGCAYERHKQMNQHMMDKLEQEVYEIKPFPREGSLMRR